MEVGVNFDELFKEGGKLILGKRWTQNEFLDLACTLVHPQYRATAVRPDIEEVIKWATEVGPVQLREWRREQIKRWWAQAKELDPEEQADLGEKEMNT